MGRAIKFPHVQRTCLPASSGLLRYFFPQLGQDMASAVAGNINVSPLNGMVTVTRLSSGGKRLRGERRRLRAGAKRNDVQRRFPLAPGFAGFVHPARIAVAVHRRNQPVRAQTPAKPGANGRGKLTPEISEERAYDLLEWVVFGGVVKTE